MKSLFSTQSDDLTDFSNIGAARVFNEQIAPTFNKVESMALDAGLGDLDLDGEEAAAAERRDEQAEKDDTFFKEQAAQDDEFLGLGASDIFGEEPSEVIPSFLPQQATEAVPAQGGGSEESAGGSTAPPVVNRGKFSSSTRRREIASKGGAAILLDSNWKSGNGITSPLIVIPDNASPGQKKAARAYVEAVAQVQRDVFGRKLKPRVVTRSQNGRGRSNAFHTEGFAVTDSKFVKYLQTPEGRQRYSGILKSTLGKIGGVEFFLPHSKKDPGAVNKKLGVSEVSLASDLLDNL